MWGMQWGSALPWSTRLSQPSHATWITIPTTRGPAGCPHELPNWFPWQSVSNSLISLHGNNSSRSPSRVVGHCQGFPQQLPQFSPTAQPCKQTSTTSAAHSTCTEPVEQPDEARPSCKLHEDPISLPLLAPHPHPCWFPTAVCCAGAAWQVLGALPSRGLQTIPVVAEGDKLCKSDAWQMQINFILQSC